MKLRLLLFAASVAFASDADEAVFREKLQPVLRENCASCHSGSAAQAGLSVESLKDLLKGGKRGPAIQPGRSSSSLLVQFARGEVNPRMPIGGKPLPDATITALAAAIDSMKPAAAVAGQQAYSKWVFSPPAVSAVPEVRRKEWVRNPIDAFILARLEEKNMTPAGPAAKRALLRRVYFDLIGLPPTMEQSEAFLRDESPDAYDRLVDRLLADKR